MWDGGSNYENSFVVYENETSLQDTCNDSVQGQAGISRQNYFSSLLIPKYMWHDKSQNKSTR
jgi:hypothetical protein